MANKEINKIAGDLQALLESSKVKPIVTSEDVVVAPKSLNEEETIAADLASTVFRNIPEGTDAEKVGLCILAAAKFKAEELGLNSNLVVESALDYCLKIAETLNKRLDESVE